MAPGAPPDPRPEPPRDPGRSLRWRVGTAFAGVLLAGAGVSTILWPAVLSYAVGGAIGLLGAFLVVTALLARAR